MGLLLTCGQHERSLQIGNEIEVPSRVREPEHLEAEVLECPREPVVDPRVGVGAQRVAPDDDGSTRCQQRLNRVASLRLQLRYRWEGRTRRAHPVKGSYAHAFDAYAIARPQPTGGFI